MSKHRGKKKDFEGYENFVRHGRYSSSTTLVIRKCFDPPTPWSFATSILPCLFPAKNICYFCDITSNDSTTRTVIASTSTVAREAHKSRTISLAIQLSLVTYLHRRPFVIVPPVSLYVVTMPSRRLCRIVAASLSPPSGVEIPLMNTAVHFSPEVCTSSVAVAVTLDNRPSPTSFFIINLENITGEYAERRKKPTDLL